MEEPKKSETFISEHHFNKYSKSLVDMAVSLDHVERHEDKTNKLTKKKILNKA